MHTLDKNLKKHFLVLKKRAIKVQRTCHTCVPQPQHTGSMTHDNHSVSDQVDEVSLLHVHEMFLLGVTVRIREQHQLRSPRVFQQDEDAVIGLSFSW